LWSKQLGPKSASSTRFLSGKRLQSRSRIHLPSGFDFARLPLLCQWAEQKSSNLSISLNELFPFFFSRAVQPPFSLYSRKWRRGGPKGGAGNAKSGGGGGWRRGANAALPDAGR
jgi:hypothetical protein